MSHSSFDLPALLGGTPVRPQGPPDWPRKDPAIDEVLEAAARGGLWGKYHGPHCEQLTEELALRHGLSHVVLCCSGTAAVELALRGVKVGQGDEVILAAYDFKGNIQDVLAVGAVPVLVDVKPDDWQFDPQHLEAAFSPQTRAVLVSHLHGGIVDMPAVMAAARARGVSVIEDACQNPGATVSGRPAGTWGDVSVMSFGGSKLLTAGRGGAVLTGDADIAQRIRLHTQRGNDAYPLTELQAALLLPQLAQLGASNARRLTAASHLVESWAGILGFRPFLSNSADSRPGYYKLGVQYDPRAFGGLSRDTFARAVRAEGVALDPGFRALHSTHSRRRYRAVGELTNATEAGRNVLTLHHPVLLESEQMLDAIGIAIRKVARHADQLLALPAC
ncbi:MAG: aminotransferase class V-fold PLP-dependent enzyme [Planctomycetaceae bacterium]|nr:aminotransferase class V-fold PLP-dependent enzyme [Planctomycetaceae bacterium]